MLRWRLLLGAVFIGALVALAWMDARAAQPGVWLFGLAMVVGYLAADEMVRLYRGAGYHPLPVAVVGGTLLVIASNAIPMFWLEIADDRALLRLGWPLMAFALAVMAAFVGEMRRYRQPGDVTTNLAVSVLAIAYVGVLLSFAIQLRLIDGPAIGMVGLLSMIAVVKLSDIGAYTVGRLFGRNKMAPRISPGKTMEGAAGGLLFACAGAWAAFTWLPVWLECTLPEHAWGPVAFGLLVGLAGMLGDLAESLLKRDLGQKDSSTWLPGFGGVLDLVDSILFAAPVAYIIWLAWVSF